jgi:hypothetical protein
MTATQARKMSAIRMASIPAAGAVMFSELLEAEPPLWLAGGAPLLLLLVLLFADVVDVNDVSDVD